MCNHCGLKYLGQTIQDPFKYKGSGKYWKNHIKIYGYDVTTKIIFVTEETKIKIAEKLKGNTHFKGHTHTEETKSIMRERQLNIEHILCIFCNKKFKPAHFKRWHGKNCKENYHAS
jgi:hypothetical protein